MDAYILLQTWVNYAQALPPHPTHTHIVRKHYLILADIHKLITHVRHLYRVSIDKWENTTAYCKFPPLDIFIHWWPLAGRLNRKNHYINRNYCQDKPQIQLALCCAQLRLELQLWKTKKFQNRVTNLSSTPEFSMWYRHLLVPWTLNKVPLLYFKIRL